MINELFLRLLELIVEVHKLAVKFVEPIKCRARDLIRDIGHGLRLILSLRKFDINMSEDIVKPLLKSFPVGSQSRDSFVQLLKSDSVGRHFVTVLLQSGLDSIEPEVEANGLRR